MRKLTEQDLSFIAGITFHGYYVENIRIKQGGFTDSGHYGVILGRNTKGHYATWQFHLDEKDDPTFYWGHYFMEDKESAVHDFHSRIFSGVRG